MTAQLEAKQGQIKINLCINKLKAFADDKMNVTEKLKVVLRG